jgi:hypothetical protein
MGSGDGLGRNQGLESARRLSFFLCIYIVRTLPVYDDTEILLSVHNPLSDTI